MNASAASNATPNGTPTATPTAVVLGECLGQFVGMALEGPQVALGVAVAFVRFVEGEVGLDDSIGRVACPALRTVIVPGMRPNWLLQQLPWLGSKQQNDPLSASQGRTLTYLFWSTFRYVVSIIILFLFLIQSLPILPSCLSCTHSSHRPAGSLGL
jgi:hypothetical protein